MGKLTEAEAEYRAGPAFHKKLVAEHPAVIDYRSRLCDQLPPPMRPVTAENQ